MADSTLISNIANPQLAQFDQPMSLQDMATKVQSNKVKLQGDTLSLQQMQQDISDMNKARALWGQPGMRDPQTGMPTPAYVNAVGSIRPELAEKASKSIQEYYKNDAEINWKKAETLAKTNGMGVERAQLLWDVGTEQTRAAVSAYDRTLAAGGSKEAAQRAADTAWLDTHKDVKASGKLTGVSEEQEAAVLQQPRDIDRLRGRLAAAKEGPKDAPLSEVGKIRADEKKGFVSKKDADAMVSKKEGTTDRIEPLDEFGKKAAEELIAAGKSLPGGWSKQGMSRGNAILNDMGRMEKGGAGSGSIVAGQAVYKADAGALSAITKDLNTFEPYKKMLDTNADIAIQLGHKIEQTAPVLVNKPLNWLRQNATTNPDVAEYLAQMRFVKTEAARVINNPRIVGQLTDESRHEIDEVVNGNAPIAVVERVLNRLKTDGTNRFNAMRSQQQEIIKGLKGQGGWGASSPSGPATQTQPASATPEPTYKDWGEADAAYMRGEIRTKEEFIKILREIDRRGK